MQTRSCTVEKKTAETGSYIDPESVAVCFRSTGCRVSEQRPGNLYIEKLDQRSHKKAVMIVPMPTIVGIEEMPPPPAR